MVSVSATIFKCISRLLKRIVYYKIFVLDLLCTAEKSYQKPLNHLKNYRSRLFTNRNNISFCKNVIFFPNLILFNEINTVWEAKVTSFHKCFMRIKSVERMNFVTCPTSESITEILTATRAVRFELQKIEIEQIIDE